MRKYLRNLVAAASLGLTAFAAVAMLALAIVPVQAQRGPVPRMFQTQQTHYLRFTLNFNSCAVAAGTTCTVKVGALPYNAFLTTIHKQIITVFNPTTSATWSLGTTSATATEIMAAFNVFTGQSTAAVTDTSFTGAGELATGATATSTGSNGGFDVWAKYTTGASASQGTTGVVVFIIEYIAPNDGSCAPVPLGSTAAAC